MGHREARLRSPMLAEPALHIENVLTLDPLRSSFRLDPGASHTGA